MKYIPVLWLNLNRQFIYDKSPDNENPRNILLIYYVLPLGNDIFNHSGAIINNVCDIILILLFKWEFSVLSEAWVYLENRNGCLFDFRYCNDNCHLLIMTDKG